MQSTNKNYHKYIFALFLIITFSKISISQNALKKYLYVTEPGIRNYLEYGGHGILVYDIEDNYKLIKRIQTGSYDEKNQPVNVKGVAVSLATQCIYVSTVKSLMCIDLTTEKLLWEKILPNGFDRMSISPDGLTIFQPSFEKEQWYVIDAKSGMVKEEILVNNKAHNTIFGANGKEVYLEGLGSPNLTVVSWPIFICHKAFYN
jgi:hypothetical protein